MSMLSRCLLFRTYFAIALLVSSFPSLITTIEAADQSSGTDRVRGGDLSIHWDLLRNDDDSQTHHARWTITNHGTKSFAGGRWTIYFNQLHLAHRDPILKIDLAVRISQFSGDLMKLQPTAAFKPIPSGGSFSFEYHGKEPINKESWAPAGPYIVFENDQGKEESPELIRKITVEPFTRPEQINRGKNDQTPIPTPAFLQSQNSKLSRLPPNQLMPITPTPVVYQANGATRTIDSHIIIRFVAGLASDAGYLSQQLRPVLGAAPRTEPGNTQGPDTILLKLDAIEVGGDRKQAGSEAYRLDITADRGIIITGADVDGVFYGIQSLLQLLPPTSFAGGLSNVTLPIVLIEDAPRYAYRGQHIDVSHNFHGKASILKLLDVMAFYKMNRLHFQVSDDEGWRIEIPELPELTEISAGRAHTSNHDGALHPNYGAGPFRDPPSFGSGFYSRQDYIEILKHARDLHI
ncbi:MAG: hypothetical protein FJ267_12140, partial [Planctomycetes bacterium]|nr:hypothetical protein [Planctomycetota bacterium]